MSCETPDPIQNALNAGPNIEQNTPTTLIENSSRWREKAARILAVAALMTSGMVVTETVHPKAAMAADSDTYSWSNATTLYEPGDDYGYATCPSNDTGCKGYPDLLYTSGGITYGEADPWGYALRNCTSYVAKKINQEFGVNISGWGNAADWASYASAHTSYGVYAHGDGYTPQVGDIAVWGSEVGGGFGHVAYVASVSGSGNSAVATFDEYNVHETGDYTNYYTSADHPGGQVYPDDYIHIGTLSAPEGTSMVAVQSNGNVLWTYNMDTGAGYDVNLPMAPGTSPAISGSEVAVQSNDGNLWIYNMDTGIGTDVKLPMASGTSPAISGSEVAVQSNGGVLWTYNIDTTKGFDVNLPMEAGTSPAISGSEVAVAQSNGNVLWTYNMNTGAGTDVNLPMAPGTSPSISGSEVAVQSNGNVLWTYDMNTGAGYDVKLPMAGNTSPSISGSEVAVESNSDVLWTYDIDTGAGTDAKLPMEADTSPTISGTEVAVQSNGNVLWTYDIDTEAGTDAKLPMAGNSSPSMS